MDGTEVVTTVPKPLAKLLRLVMRGFYHLEPMLIMDLLLRNSCMKEADIMELLKLDKKQMGISIKQLKNDQFLKVRMKMESDSEGKATKHNYYFINYTGFVNVVKYKLDHVRRKIEVQERDSTSRASFKCGNCLKMYTDLEADHLFDPNSCTFKCMMCGEEMEEQQSTAPVKDARALVTKFNEQIKELYELLMECDKFKLSHTILEPAPKNLEEIRSYKKAAANANSATGQNANLSERTWSGDVTKNIEYGFTASEIDVKVGDAALHVPNTSTKKEQPTWMSRTTIDAAKHLNKVENDTPHQVGKTPALSTSIAQADSNIMHTLLVHESKSQAASHALSAAQHSDKSDESDLEDVVPTHNDHPMADMNESGEEEEEEMMVAIGDREVPFHEAAELVDQMTDEQREEYNRLAQSVYSDMYA